ncbi:FISUMP domain-containing protein [uncultured Fibrobacter sp.]|uniref:FISUMP domain-containing protein n=1 Tax=uncultured Fibrobacter sp. TaxID=261512 RepID=UPI0025F09BA3|nr:FISUMP domain-containing protein [uncultured Fibrobacter sp.]
MKKLFICSSLAYLLCSCGGDSATSPSIDTGDKTVSSSSIESIQSSSAKESSDSKESSSSSATLSSSSEEESSSSEVIKGFPANYNPETGILTDERDGEVYKTAKIGDQIWMGQNLRFLPKDFVDGCDLRWIDEREKPDSLDTYGRTYSWTEATRISCNYLTKKISFGDENYPLPFKGICPKGWHIPSLDEWKIMIESTNQHLYKLLSTDWVKPGYSGTDEYGFNVLKPANGTHVEFIMLDNTGAKSQTMVFNDIGGSTIQLETIRSEKTAEGIYLRCLMD